jgi:hypothetical protein
MNDDHQPHVKIDLSTTTENTQENRVIASIGGIQLRRDCGMRVLPMSDRPRIRQPEHRTCSNQTSGSRLPVEIPAWAAAIYLAFTKEYNWSLLRECDRCLRRIN